MRSSVFTLFPPVVRGTLVLTGWSRHCRITAGLASMDMPLLVSLLSLSAGGAVRGSTAPVGWSGVSPYFAYCPSSSVPNRSSFWTSASGFRFKVFAMGSPFRVGSVSVLDRIEDSCSTFLVYASSLRDGVTLSGRGLFQISIETKTCLAHLPLWLVSGLRVGITHFKSSGSFLRPRSERKFLPFFYP